jgi:hypothetical protein
MSDEYRPNYEISVTGENGMFYIHCLNCDGTQQFLSQTSLETVNAVARDHDERHAKVAAE